jgi:hypothetical protein
MNDRKHCDECELEYSDEASHRLVHDAVLASTRRVDEPPEVEIPQS